MKVLALSDEVVDKLYSPAVRQYAGLDLVVGCGDLPYFYLEYVASMLDVPVAYVPGNHDSHEQVVREGQIIVEAQGCLNLDGRVAHVDHLLLAGLGGSIRYRPDGQNQYTQSEMFWRACGLAPALVWQRSLRQRRLDILLTHAPPFGVHDAADPAHVGFKAFHGFMRAFRPRCLLHGHVHVYRRDDVTETRVGETRVINVYPYRVIEL